ncbi:dihydrofolate reductase [uncultured Bacteroides sp.]|uniref:dihydrofolate reductase n=1 Tax=uncultured Bacteroides sp. TaxID=162156 RepID=UPI002AABCB61|nr:dihydrofolate reductase [uncultured Bacteroides sp.]
MSKVSIIVAASQNNAIGRDNQLLYRLSNDLKRFKALTTGHTVIMGRNTFESLPKGALPNRRNLVLSTNPQAEFKGAERFSSLEEALAACQAEEEVFIIGGDSVYKQAISIADAIYLTLIEDVAKDADAFFPEIKEEEWKETGRESHSIDEKHHYPYIFIDYKRR